MVKTPSVIAATPETLLHWARRREQAGDLIGSGVCLRAALHRQLLSMTIRHRCVPRSRDWRNSPARLLTILRDREVLTAWEGDYCRDAIHVCNAAAHVGSLERQKLRAAIWFVGNLLEEFPAGAPRETGKAVQQ